MENELAIVETKCTGSSSITIKIEGCPLYRVNPQVTVNTYEDRMPDTIQVGGAQPQPIGKDRLGNAAYAGDLALLQANVIKWVKGEITGYNEESDAFKAVRGDNANNGEFYPREVIIYEPGPNNPNFKGEVVR